MTTVPPPARVVKVKVFVADTGGAGSSVPATSSLSLPLPQQEVDDLDRALAAVGLELAVDELIVPKLMPPGNMRRLAEVLRVARVELGPKSRSSAMPKPRQRGLRHRAAAVLLARVVEDVEHVDLLAPAAACRSRTAGRRSRRAA